MTIFEKIRKIGISQFVCFIFITTAMFFWSRFFSDKEFSWATIYEHREDTKMYIAKTQKCTLLYCMDLYRPFLYMLGYYLVLNSHLQNKMR